MLEPDVEHAGEGGEPEAVVDGRIVACNDIVPRGESPFSAIVKR